MLQIWFLNIYTILTFSYSLSFFSLFTISFKFESLEYFWEFIFGKCIDLIVVDCFYLVKLHKILNKNIYSNNQHTTNESNDAIIEYEKYLK